LGRRGIVGAFFVIELPLLYFSIFLNPRLALKKGRKNLSRDKMHLLKLGESGARRHRGKSLFSSY
jgi:uncharacterized membrane protein